MAKGISVTHSRFAILPVEDDDDDGDNETQNASSKSNAKSNTQSAASKKKNKKKKQKQDSNISEELKHMAFGKPVRHHRDSDKSGSVKPDQKQWVEWKEKDEEFTQDSYQKDLEQALLQSKQDFEKQVQKKKENGAVNGVEGKQKKKKKDKAPVMSLEQFNQLQFKKEKSIDSDDDADSPQPVITTPVIKTSVGEGDTHFFDKVDDDVVKIISKEKIQEEYKKHYAIESAITLKYQDELSKKDEEIAHLKSALTTLQDEFKQVKKRNKQLCVILAQGEMKDKAQVLMHVEDLTQVRDELTEQVSELNAELEKEKSKVHALKLEVEKLKGGKHHGK
ncbi:G kinase-anchoring protein 1-like isoform X1 [Gigantopelta aegis]|uniref:G kinase-anchoring protein 1-like isoform X1 n=1 Tax=Gigantopelta aegis TaxID=1735272 RepID=UPI001B88B923|nr:G kinase-anchoring protein 1-like isoform X1 [Gigantopelta aegis]